MLGSAPPGEAGAVLNDVACGDVAPQSDGAELRPSSVARSSHELWPHEALSRVPRGLALNAPSGGVRGGSCVPVTVPPHAVTAAALAHTPPVSTGSG